jgi:uncharacterized UPF0160 family protein
MPKIIITHGDGFHADDVFACVVLSELFPDSKIIRTRDETQFKNADFLVDVGGEYDPLTDRFDHHQTEFYECHLDSGIKMSSVGLVWKKYGIPFCESITKDQDIVENVARRVGWNLIQIIDANDNGVEVSTPISKGITPYSVSQIIASFNPVWYEENPDYDFQFFEAMKIAKSILLNEVLKAYGGEIAKYRVSSLVGKAIRRNQQYIDLGDYIPWQGVVIKESDPNQFYVIFKQRSTGDWRLQGIPNSLGSYSVRKPLPKEWRGIDKEELNRLLGESDVTFCHSAGFVAGASSKNTIMKMLHLALNQ